MQRLSKVLANHGIASRRACEKIIFDNRVTVNGKTASSPQTMVDATKDLIAVDGQRLPSEEEKLYFILNKPKGFLCTNAQDTNKKKVLDLFSEISARLFTVGRLDKDTTGLLLVTNDGHFAQSVIHPSKNIEKEYLVKVQQEITHNHLKKIAKGSLVEGKWIVPVSVKKVRKGSIKIVVKEGKKHEVRILIKNAGLTIEELKRIRIGPITLGSLLTGAFRKMTKKEISLFLS